MIARRTFLGGVAAGLAACAVDPRKADPGRASGALPQPIPEAETGSASPTTAASPPRSEVTMFPLPTHSITKSFTATSLRPALMPMGHVLNVDHFTMSEPTFPPHPHAGFCAVTWMLPWSQGAFTNRDSLGDRSLIKPGALHWTQAGSGMLHEEIPEVPGTPCEGLQIFVKLPEPEELTPPRAFHVAPDEVPVAAVDGGEVRVLVGQFGQARSTIPTSSQTEMLHVSVRGRMALEVPAGLQAFGLVLRGSGQVGREVANVHDAFSPTTGLLELEGDSLELLVGWSAPLPSRPTFQGPFCMFSRERLAQTSRAYHAGEMGHLEPSKTRWSSPG